MKISTIKWVRQISSSPLQDEYSGKLTINYDGDLIRPLRPTEVDMYFTTGSTGQVLECGARASHKQTFSREKERCFQISPSKMKKSKHN